MEQGINRYFRTVYFLSRTSFHVESDVETLAAMILCRNAFDFDYRNNPDTFYRMIFGEADNITLEQFKNACRKYGILYDESIDLVKNLDNVQAELRKLPDPKINDELLEPDEWPAQAKGFRFLGARYIPDAEFLLKTCEPNMKGRKLPKGLDVGVLLGLKNAISLLKKQESPGTVDKIIKVAGETEINDTCLYCRFLSIIKDYYSEMEKNAKTQRVFQTDAWKFMTLNTVLCAWVQIRHAAALAGKEASTVLCAHRTKPAGAVEPVSETYLRLAVLYYDYEAWLNPKDRHENVNQIARKVLNKLVPRFKAYMDITNKIKKEKNDDNKKKLRFQMTEEMCELMKIICRYEMNTDILGSEMYGKKLVETLEKYARKIVAGKATDDEKTRMKIVFKLKSFDEYSGFAKLCTQLSRMAQKQVKGIPFSAKENYILSKYQKILGNLHFYQSNSWEIPKDDMPVACMVIKSNLPPEQVLIAGIGRARKMKILIKDHVSGKWMLCTAGITLYHEHVTTAPMTDTEWSEKLKSTKGPKPAKWIAKYIVE